MINMLTLPKNDKGRDFFVGDIHGCYDLLMTKLDEIKFDQSKDRLISVGDLADRGPASLQCVHLIKEPWFFAVRGNHEDMAVGVSQMMWERRNFKSNGGGWYFELTAAVRMEVVELMDSLPLCIEVPYKDKLIGVLHADAIAKSWNEYRDDDVRVESIIWGRQRIIKEYKEPVADVDVVVVGHTPVDHPIALGNVIYIDTGAVYDGILTILSAQEVLDFIEKKDTKRPDDYQDILSTEDCIIDALDKLNEQKNEK